MRNRPVRVILFIVGVFKLVWSKFPVGFSINTGFIKGFASNSKQKTDFSVCRLNLEVFIIREFKDL